MGLAGLCTPVIHRLALTLAVRAGVCAVSVAAVPVAAVPVAALSLAGCCLACRLLDELALAFPVPVWLPAEHGWLKGRGKNGSADAAAEVLLLPGRCLTCGLPVPVRLPARCR